MTLNVFVSRHSAFYTPLIATLAGGFLKRENLDSTYAVLPAGVPARDLIRRGEAHVVQSAVSSSWVHLDKGERGLPVHFAQINCRDGFFLAAREPEANFDFRRLEGRPVLADHAFQPLAMLRYCARWNGCDWDRVKLIDGGAPDKMERAYRAGEGDYVHLQGPAPQQLEREGLAHVVASIGERMPKVAFSSLIASHDFLATEAARGFISAYRRARSWVTSAPAVEIAQMEAEYFPGVPMESLAQAIGAYQRIGCWRGDIAIAEALYEQALKVFLDGGRAFEAYSYREIVVPPPDGA